MLKLFRTVAEPGQTNKAVLLDADGVLWEDKGPGTVLGLRNVAPTVVDTLEQARAVLGPEIRLIVLSNQTCVARGMCTEKTLSSSFETLLLSTGLIDGVYLSLSHPEASVPKYRRQSENRKPATGMFEAARQDWGLTMSNCVMIGDRITDMLAAVYSGVSKAYLIVGRQSFDLNVHSQNHSGSFMQAQFDAISSLLEIDWHWFK